MLGRMAQSAHFSHRLVRLRQQTQLYRIALFYSNRLTRTIPDLNYVSSTADNLCVRCALSCARGSLVLTLLRRDVQRLWRQ